MSGADAVVSFADLIFHHALSVPAKPAIILPDRVVTYGMMAQGILHAEDRVHALDLNPGDLVCLSIDSPIRTMVLAAALFRLAHPVIITGRPGDCLAVRLPVGAFLHEPGVSLIPGQRQAIIDDSWFAGEGRQLAAGVPKGFADDRKVCCVALSSGTTGQPKPISLTIGAFQQWVTNYYSVVGLGAWERLLLLIGLTTNWGFSLAAHALFAGRTLLFAGNPREALHMIAVYAADAMAATSLQLRDIVREQTREPLPCASLRLVFTGGAALSRGAITEARASLCSSIVYSYGSSEAGSSAFGMADQLLDAEGATGFVAPWTQIECMDGQDGHLPPGEEGIIRIRAACQGAPYPPGAENASFRDGWFYPGDLGRVTAEGRLIITGRTSDVINVGGLKLAPELIEETLRRHPAIVDAAAFGSMGDSGIEELSAAVVVNKPVADSHLIDWCTERGIPLTRVFCLDELPKTASGKLRRNLLKRRLLQADVSA